MLILKINVGDAQGEKKNYFVNLRIFVYCEKARLVAAQICQTADSPISYF
jgi:hypothetical protein